MLLPFKEHPHGSATNESLCRLRKQGSTLPPPNGCLSAPQPHFWASPLGGKRAGPQCSTTRSPPPPCLAGGSGQPCGVCGLSRGGEPRRGCGGVGAWLFEGGR